MDALLNTIAKHVRQWMLVPAKILNHISGGLIRPNHVTLVSFLGHFTVMWALWQQRPIVAACLLVLFGLMDSLDGALARVQQRQSKQGMFYDAVSDRAKEIVLYIGIAKYADSNGLFNMSNTSQRLVDWLFYDHNIDISVWLPVAVLGCSLLISYIKAKGEMAIANSKTYKNKDINRVFADGIARYEVRMFVIVLGLLTGNVMLSLVVLFGLLLFTICQRFLRISKVLKHV